MPNNQSPLCKTEDTTDPSWADHELVDSGAFQKLERFVSQSMQKEKSIDRRIQQTIYAKLEEGIQ